MVKTSHIVIGAAAALGLAYIMRPKEATARPGTGLGLATVSESSLPTINLDLGELAPPQPSGGLDLAALVALLSPAPSSPTVIVVPSPVAPVAPVAAGPVAPVIDFSGLLDLFLGDAAAGATDDVPVLDIEVPDVFESEDQDANQGTVETGPGLSDEQQQFVEDFFANQPPPTVPAPTQFISEENQEILDNPGVTDENPLTKLSRFFRAMIPSPVKDKVPSEFKFDIADFGDVAPLNPDGTVRFGFDGLDPDRVFSEFVDRGGELVPNFNPPNLNPLSGLGGALNDVGQDFKIVSEAGTGAAFVISKAGVVGKLATKLPLFAVASKAFLPLTVLDLLVTGYEFYTGTNVPVLGNRELILGAFN